MTAKKDIATMHGLHLQTFFEYDEGFLADDARLAGAIWRCLYIQRNFDPIHVANVIKYMRGTVAYLDTIPSMDILAQGVPKWLQLPEPL